jgi:hypothetical protein
MKKSDKLDITFRKLPIPPFYGPVVKDIYYVAERDKSYVMSKFQKLNRDTQDSIKDLICRMATNANFKSPKIINHLTGYEYGEIRPIPHRFFFFHQGDCIIFFSYVLKKTDTLKDEIYKAINRDKEKYEDAFKTYIQENR